MRLLRERLESFPLALALLPQGLRGLTSTLGLVVHLLYPILEEVLSEPKVALLQRNGPVRQRLKGLTGSIS